MPVILHLATLPPPRRKDAIADLHRPDVAESSIEVEVVVQDVEALPRSLSAVTSTSSSDPQALEIRVDVKPTEPPDHLLPAVKQQAAVVSRSPLDAGDRTSLPGWAHSCMPQD
eukprot:750549-Hanusia_phi.AAC.8